MIIDFLTQRLEQEIEFNPPNPENSLPDVNQIAAINRLPQKIVVPEKFEKDISALRAFIGESAFLPGQSISISLQNLLKCCSRGRARTDSYDSLVRYLKDTMNITLSIYSQKNKKS